MADIIDITRGGLHDQVTQRLRTLLVEGRIAPGAKLNERELCELLKVSRTPLREAIKRLAAEGLVDLLPNRGAVAVKLTTADVEHAFEVLAALEGLSGELAATRASDAGIAEIQALHYEMRACHARRDLSGYYRLNAQIHAAINAAAGNPVLMQTFTAMNARVQSLRFRTNQDAAKWQRAVLEHEQMVQALSARDGAALRQVLVQHLQHKRDAVLQLMHSGTAYVGLQGSAP
ncbi:MAG: GntR family transcriptional regulator [Rubrivivax sp.]|jgi:DNA-binding GntR family transcriptional regulator|nr:GntR family transcriptional regulator [Rubrivivax sp.]MBK8526457.1 GntR family transcriptional regulator [Rubrivivax sp.]